MTARTERSDTGSYRRATVPLVWKLLVPYVALLVAVGSFGAFLIVRDLSSRAQSSLDRELGRRSVDASAYVHEQELYVLESANLAANLQGMADAMTKGDRARAANLLRSVLALKTDATVALVTDRSGRIVAGLARQTGASSPRDLGQDAVPGAAAINEALASPSGAPTAGFLAIGGKTVLAVLAPACTAGPACSAAGVALVGVDVAALVDTALTRAVGNSPAGGSGAGLYSPSGPPLAIAGALAAPRAPVLPSNKVVRRNEPAKGHERVAVLYAPLDVQGRPQATLAVSVPKRAAFASVSAAGWRVGLIVVAAIAGVVAIGLMLSRFILRQIRSLLDTNRALGAGDLAARAPVLANDELGELARGVNQMAEQLQASYETLEERVRERTDEVQRLLQQRTELFTSVSHEFRTPLAVILAQAEAMQDSSYTKTARWCAESGRAVEQSAQQLLTFINDVLELARTESGDVEITPEVVALPAFVRDLRPTLDRLVAASELSLKVAIPRDLTPLVADPARLGEIIVNLVDNAAKYTPAGGRVELSATNGGGRVEVSVADTGVGIPDDVGDRIFEPFFRVKGTRTQRSQPSSGLGLAVTKRLVEAQGGSIRFASQPGAGTTLTFSLPAAQPAP